MEMAGGLSLEWGPLSLLHADKTSTEHRRPSASQKFVSKAPALAKKSAGSGFESRSLV